MTTTSMQTVEERRAELEAELAELNASTEAPRPAGLVAQRPAVVNFFSRRRNQYLVMEPRVPQLAPVSGRQVTVSKGAAVQFKNHVLSVPLSGKMPLANGGHMADAREILDWLTGNEDAGIPPHHLFDDRFEGFWMEAALAPAPTAEELERLTMAATDGNRELLEQLIAEERDQWDRPEFLSLAERALARVDEHIATLAEAAEADRARAEAEAAVEARLAAREAAVAEAEAKLAIAPPVAADEPQTAPQGPENPDEKAPAPRGRRGTAK
jgi:hypothetical protein